MSMITFLLLCLPPLVRILYLGLLSFSKWRAFSGLILWTFHNISHPPLLLLLADRPRNRMNRWKKAVCAPVLYWLPRKMRRYGSRSRMLSLKGVSRTAVCIKELLPNQESKDGNWESCAPRALNGVRRWLRGREREREREDKIRSQGKRGGWGHTPKTGIVITNFLSSFSAEFQDDFLKIEALLLIKSILCLFGSVRS